MTLEQIQQEKDPVYLLRERVLAKLKDIYPGKNIDMIIDSFLMDILSVNNIPSMLHRMSPERQEELLLGKAPTLEESFNKIISNIPEDIVEFYRKKLEEGRKKFDL